MKGVLNMKKTTVLLVLLLIFCMTASALAEGGFVFRDAAQKPAEEIDTSIHAGTGLKLYNRRDEKAERQWFENNTVCLRGLYLRDIAPGLTSLWYNIVPIDLTKQGRQTYDLIASNLYFVGKAYVDISGDQLTVSYDYYESEIAYPISECAALFTSMDELTAEYLDNPVPNFTVGRAVSISGDLNGSETALLFMLNRMTYTNPYDTVNHLLTRYWPNHRYCTKSQAAMRELLLKIK